MPKLTDEKKIAQQIKKHQKTAERYAMKLTPTEINGVVYGTTRKVTNTNLFAMVTTDGKRYIFPVYDSKDTLMINGKPSKLVTLKKDD